MASLNSSIKTLIVNDNSTDTLTDAEINAFWAEIDASELVAV